jgi:hypothetical protein
VAGRVTERDEVVITGGEPEALQSFPQIVSLMLDKLVTAKSARDEKGLSASFADADARRQSVAKED